MTNLFRKKNHSKKSQNIEYFNKNQAGFSLIELLIYMGLFSGFLLVLGALFVSTLEAQQDASTSSHSDQDSWYVLSRLQHDLYQATSVVVPSNLGEQNSSLILDLDGSQVTYSLIENKLAITKNSESTSLVSEHVSVSNLSFTRLGNEGGTSSIIVEMQLQNSTDDQKKDINIVVGIRQ